MDIFQKGSGSTTVSLSVTTTSGRIALTGTGGSMSQCRVAVSAGSGATFCFVAFGADNTVTATSADIAMIPGTTEVFSIGQGVTYIAALTDAGTCTLKAITGIGG